MHHPTDRIIQEGSGTQHKQDNTYHGLCYTSRDVLSVSLNKKQKNIKTNVPQNSPVQMPPHLHSQVSSLKLPCRHENLHFSVKYLKQVRMLAFCLSVIAPKCYYGRQLGFYLAVCTRK